MLHGALFVFGFTIGLGVFVIIIKKLISKLSEKLRIDLEIKK